MIRRLRDSRSGRSTAGMVVLLPRLRIADSRAIRNPQSFVGQLLRLGLQTTNRTRMVNIKATAYCGAGGFRSVFSAPGGLVDGGAGAWAPAGGSRQHRARTAGASHRRPTF